MSKFVASKRRATAWGGTGIDALSHALEAWCAPAFHPIADGLAEALAMIRDALPRVHAQPEDIAGRSDMLIASGMACVALQKGLGAVHALSHPIGAVHDAHHGVLNGILLPHGAAPESARDRAEYGCSI